MKDEVKAFEHLGDHPYVLQLVDSGESIFRAQGRNEFDDIEHKVYYIATPLCKG